MSKAKDSRPGKPGRFRRLVETLPLAVYADRPGDPASFSYVSPQIEEMFGYSLEQWRQDSFFADILHPDDRERVLAERKTALANRSRQASFGYRIVNADGKPLTVRDEAVVIAANAGQPHLQGYIADVTESVRRQRELEAVSLIAASAGSVRDMREFYEEMHRVVGELTNADNCYVALYDEELDRVKYPYYVDSVDLDLPDPDLWEPAGRGLTAYVLRTGRSMLADRETRGELTAKGEIENVGADAVDWLGIPLCVDDRTLGVLAIQSYDERVRYDEEDKALLTAVGGHIASALERTRLHAQTRQHVRELEAMSRISEALVAQPDVDALIDLAGALLEDTFASDFTYVALFDPEEELISFPFFSEGGTRLSRPSLPLGDGPTSAVLRRQEPVLLHGEADFDSIGERRVGARIGSYLGVPDSRGGSSDRRARCAVVGDGAPLRRRRCSSARSDRRRMSDRRSGTPISSGSNVSRSDGTASWSRRFPSPCTGRPRANRTARST